MGRRHNTRLSIGFVLFALVSFQQFTIAQSTITGMVTNTNNEPLPYVNVVIKDSINIISYGYTDEDGTYSMYIEKKGRLSVTFSALGYKPQTVSLQIGASTKETTLHKQLEERLEQLDEVIIRTELPMVTKKDTIGIRVKYFTDGTEQTVEDLLEKIPGLQVDSEGTIKVGNQEIEKLMVEGDDLFEKGYKILSKNMPAHPIEEVEILQNFSNNRLLKDIEDSNKVALNLKLYEDSKRIWFGNIETSMGSAGFYQAKGNLMNFGKTNKYYFLTNLNSIGYNATGDINHLIRPLRHNEPASIGDNQYVNTLLDLTQTNLNFKKSRTNFNNAELVSLNAIFNPTDKFKIKTLGFFNWDETNFFRNATNVVDVNGTSFTNTEAYELSNKKRIAFGKLDFVYNITKTKTLESITKYNNGDFTDNSNLIFNGNSTIENLQHKNTLFDQKINYTNKFKDKKVFLITGRFINEKIPQDYSINQFFYQDLFPESTNANNVLQLNKNQMQFIGFNAHLMDRKDNGSLLELQLGNAYRKDRLSTTFSLLENETELEQPNGYQNQTKYQTNNLYLKGKYRLKFKNLEFITKLGLHQLFNRLKNNTSSSKQNPFFINPSIGIDWEINNKNKITSSYTHNTTNAKILDVYANYMLTGFRSFYKGTADFDQLSTSSIVLDYQLGNWSDRFFANTFILYSKNHDFFSTSTTLEQNFTQSEKILIKDRQFISASAKLDYYFKFISSNLKLNLDFTKSEFKNVVNNSDFRMVTSQHYKYGLELRSGFKGFFNYHIGTKWSTTNIQTTTNFSLTNNMSFLDLSFVFNNKFDLQAQTERYYFGNLESDKVYYFLDCDARYKIIEDKLIIGISGKNLFNTKKFQSLSVSDIGSSAVEYKLLPRFLLLKLEYRF